MKVRPQTSEERWYARTYWLRRTRQVLQRFLELVFLALLLGLSGFFWIFIKILYFVVAPFVVLAILQKNDYFGIPGYLVPIYDLAPALFDFIGFLFKTWFHAINEYSLWILHRIPGLDLPPDTWFASVLSILIMIATPFLVRWAYLVGQDQYYKYLLYRNMKWELFYRDEEHWREILAHGTLQCQEEWIAGHGTAKQKRRWIVEKEEKYR